MMNLAHFAAAAHIDADSWFECSWGDGPFSLSEVLEIVLGSGDPIAAANQFHTSNIQTGSRVTLRDFLARLQRPVNAARGIPNPASEMLEDALDAVLAKC